MKLKTILFFGAIAIAVSAPKLFHNYKTEQNGQTTFGNLNSTGAFNGQPGAFATTPQNGGQPFQFAGASSAPPVTTMGNNVSTTPPTIHSSSMTWSEPVYQSFTNPGNIFVLIFRRHGSGNGGLVFSFAPAKIS